MVNVASIDNLWSRLGGSGSDDERSAIKELRRRLGDKLPDYFLREYKAAKKWKARAAIVFYAIGFPSSNEAIIALGLLALTDKSQVVQYRAAMLLSVTQRKDILPQMEQIMESLPMDKREDIIAAMDTISCQNVNYFADRRHTGKIRLNIG